MKINSLLFLCYLLYLGSTNTFAQDVFFTQYHQQAFLTNPAAANLNAEIKAWMNYRYQSLSADNNFQTITASVTYPFLKKQQISKNTWGGVGLSFFTDNQAQFLRTSGIFANMQYHFHLPKSLLSIGLQTGLFQQRVEYENLITDMQIASGLLDNAIDNGESLQNPIVNYLNLSLGLYWTQLNENLGANYFLGLAWNNANQPNISFDPQSSYQLPAHLMVQGGLRLNKEAKLSLMPNFRYLYRLQRSKLLVGTWLNYDLRSFENLFAQGELSLGVWYNTFDVFSFSLELAQPKFFFALSYDVPLSSQELRNVNALEFTFGIRKMKYNKFEKKYPGTMLPSD